MFYGLDVHKEFLQVCALDEDGETRRDFRVGGTPAAIEKFARGLDRADEVVLEATFHSLRSPALCQPSRWRSIATSSRSASKPCPRSPSRWAPSRSR